MNSRADFPSITAELEPSLIRGGPFYRAQQAAKLIRPNEWNYGRRLAWALLVGWLPLILITAISSPGAVVSVLTDYRVHSRMLIAVPVLLLGQFLMESRFRTVIKHITEADLLGASDIARMRNYIARLLRLRDSVLPEAAILLLVILHTAVSYKALVDATPWLAYGVEPDLHLTAAGWYAVLVSATIFQFLLGLGLWKWLLWTVFACNLSRLDLKVVATHPDGHGGLGFLGLTPLAFTPISFAAATAIGATWRHEIIHQHANLMTFKLSAIVLLVLVGVVAFGPLAVFVPRLAALRRRGLLEYGTLGQIHSSDFHQKWILGRSGHEGEFLTALETSTLADYGRCYEKIEEMSPFPADRGALISLGASLVVPMLPVVLAVVPLFVVVKELFKALR